MPLVVSLVQFWPPPRYDGVPWDGALIEESPAPSGPWTQIDSQALTPLDPDPSEPRVREFTTVHATLPAAWYRITFVDANGGQSDPTDPVRNPSGDGSLPPSPEEVRNRSPLLRAKYPFPLLDPFAVSDLRGVVYGAVALVQSVTWRLIDPTLGCAAAEGYVCELVPDALVPVAVLAIARSAERVAVQTEPEFAEQLATGKLLRGFSAGPYSEQYFAPGEFARRGATQGRPAMDADDALDSALWALATEDARDYFIGRATGLMPPVGAAVVFDYRRSSTGYHAGSRGGGPGRSNPDGW